MNIRPFLLLVLAAIPGCVSQSAQVEPALQTAAQLRTIFEHEQAINRDLVSRSNPAPEVFAAYVNAEDKVKAAFLGVYTAHTAYLGSLGGLSAEATATMLDQVTKSLLETLRR